jgi:predicted small lipoprotein YifL
LRILFFSLLNFNAASVTRDFEYMQKNIVRMFLLTAICCALNSCGTKGPLYIPEQQYPQPSPASK